MRRWTAWCAALVIAFAAQSHAGETPGKPFPFNRTQIVKDGTFIVTGRCRIAAGVEITIQKDTKIIGKAGESFIEVEGKLTVQGLSTSIVVIDGVTIELQPKFGDLNINGADFRGDSKGIVCPPEMSVEGRVRIADSTFTSPANVALTMCGASSVDLRNTVYYEELSIKAVAGTGTATSNVKLFMKACRAGRTGWPSGVRAEGLASVEIRESEIGGESATFRDCLAVAIDTSYVFSRNLEFVQTVAGRFGKSQVQSCDLHCSAVTLSAPETKGNPERMKIENCWFGGETSVKAIRERIVTDHDDNAERGVVASVERVAGKPLQLNWTIQR